MKHLVNGTRLNVLEPGAGSLTLVFMHYFGGSALEWQGVMNQLSARYRCLAVDLRGHGDPDGPGVDSSATGYAIDDMADDVICLTEKLAVQDVVLVGHSMSGKVALAVAAGTARADRPTYNRLAGLRQLLLVSPSPPGPEPIPEDERQKLLDGYGNRSAAEQMLKNTTSVAVSQTVRRQIIADDLRTAWDAWLNTGSREDISTRMATIDLPVHIIVGAEDRALPPDVQNRMVLPHLKNVTLKTVDGAGHLLPWETPDILARFIAKKVGA